VILWAEPKKMKTALLDPEEVSKGANNFTVYSKRWAMLVIFVLSGVANALVLLSWSPISDIASDYWGNIGATAVNLLAVSFQIMYIPGTALSAKTMKVSNLRTTMILGGLLSSVGCVIRWIGGFGRDNGNFTPVFSYVCVLLGTIVVATAQPFYLNMPAKIAAAWFAVQERDVATTLCSLANPLGSALGSILPAMIVSGSGHDVKGVSVLLLVQLIVALTGLVFTYFFFESTPPTPPSNSTMMMTSNKEENEDKPDHVWAEVKELFGKPEYVKLLIGFTIALGSFFSLPIQFHQLLLRESQCTRRSFEPTPRRLFQWQGRQSRCCVDFVWIPWCFCHRFHLRLNKSLSSNFKDVR
jgi:MFS transporter, FLVCR family, feline leukemia virus subgroup C receptor-related protein